MPTDDAETVRKKIAVTATYLDIWLMRRRVNYIRVGYSSTSYTMYLLGRDIRRKSLKELVQLLTNKLAADDVTFKGSVQKDRGGIDRLALNQFSRRYIFHLLARLTAFTDLGSGRADPFPTLVDREQKNPFDIEHIWADNYALHGGVFDSPQEFEELRGAVSALLLLPADVNRSLQDKPYSYKLQKYAMYNIYTASLATSAYINQPQFEAFRAEHGLPFKAHSSFTKAELTERKALVTKLVIWSPDRLQAFL